MKRFFGYAMLLALITAPAFAAKNSQSLTFSDPVIVGTTKLPAGDCKVTWTGTGNDVQVTLQDNGKTVTVAARMIQEKNDQVGYLAGKQNGIDQIQTIKLHNVSLVLQGTAVSGQ
jgi:hypothetical protein